MRCTWVFSFLFLSYAAPVSQTHHFSIQQGDSDKPLFLFCFQRTSVSRLKDVCVSLLEDICVLAKKHVCSAYPLLDRKVVAE